MKIDEPEITYIVEEDGSVYFNADNLIDYLDKINMQDSYFRVNDLLECLKEGRQEALQLLLNF